MPGAADGARRVSWRWSATPRRRSRMPGSRRRCGGASSRRCARRARRRGPGSWRGCAPGCRRAGAGAMGAGGRRRRARPGRVRRGTVLAGAAGRARWAVRRPPRTRARRCVSACCSARSAITSIGPRRCSSSWPARRRRARQHRGRAAAGRRSAGGDAPLSARRGRGRRRNVADVLESAAAHPRRGHGQPVGALAPSSCRPCRTASRSRSFSSNCASRRPRCGIASSRTRRPGREAVTGA